MHPAVEKLVSDSVRQSTAEPRQPSQGQHLHRKDQEGERVGDVRVGMRMGQGGRM